MTVPVKQRKCKPFVWHCLSEANDKSAISWLSWSCNCNRINIFEYKLVCIPRLRISSSRTMKLQAFTALAIIGWTYVLCSAPNRIMFENHGRFSSNTAYGHIHITLNLSSVEDALSSAQAQTTRLEKSALRFLELINVSNTRLDWVVRTL